MRRVVLRTRRRTRRSGSQPMAFRSSAVSGSVTGYDVVRCAPYRALGRSAECALRRPVWRTGGVPCGTDGMKPTYARALSSSTSCARSIRSSPSHRCPSPPRAGVVNARRPGHRPGRSEAKSIDDGEHGVSILGAVVTRLELRAAHGQVRRENRAHARTDSCGVHRHSSAVGSGPACRHTGGAPFLHEPGTPTLTRATATDGVNDPVRAPWGQVPGTAAGSFTPSFLQ